MLIALRYYQRSREEQACVSGNPHQILTWVMDPPPPSACKYYTTKPGLFAGVAHVSVLIGVEKIDGSVELLIGQGKRLSCRRTVWRCRPR